MDWQSAVLLQLESAQDVAGREVRIREGVREEHHPIHHLFYRNPFLIKLFTHV